MSILEEFLFASGQHLGYEVDIYDSDIAAVFEWYEAERASQPHEALTEELRVRLGTALPVPPPPQRKYDTDFEDDDLI